MIKSISAWFSDTLTVIDVDDDEQEKTIQYATAALLMEVSRSDSDKSPVERDEILKILNNLFEFSADEIQALIDVADDATEEAHDLYSFTSLINEHYNYDQKLMLMNNLWRVAYADERLDAFEEHIVRRIAGLIYVDHQDFIKTRNQVRDT